MLDLWLFPVFPSDRNNTAKNIFMHKLLSTLPIISLGKKKISHCTLRCLKMSIAMLLLRILWWHLIVLGMKSSLWRRDHGLYKSLPDVILPPSPASSPGSPVPITHHTRAILASFPFTHTPASAHVKITTYVTLSERHEQSQPLHAGWATQWAFLGQRL